MGIWAKKSQTLSCNLCCTGKVTRITYSECVFVASVIQHAMRVRHIAICGPASLYDIFSTLSPNRNDYREKKILNIKFVF